MQHLVNGVEFDILDVLLIQRKNVAFQTAKRNFSVISYRMNGQANFFYKGKDILVSQNDCLIIPPNVEYAQESRAENLICLHLSCNIGGDLHVLHCSSIALREYFWNLHSVWQKKEPGYLLRAKALVYNILYEILRYEMPNIFGEQNALLEPAMEYIYSNFQSSDFSVSNAIAKTYISPAYFRRLFKEVYHKTPIRFLNELRVEHAKALLEMRLYSISQIAHRAGFLNEKYFYTIFKQITGVTPSQWLSSL